MTAPRRIVVAGVAMGGLVVGTGLLWRRHDGSPVLRSHGAAPAEAARDQTSTNRSPATELNRRAQAAIRVPGNNGAADEAQSTASMRGPTPPEAAAYAAVDGDADAAAAAAAAAQERDQLVQAIRASGPDRSGLARATYGLGRVWERFAGAGAAAVNVGTWECHRAGCFAEVVHRSPDALEELTSKILASEEMTSWSGTKTRTAPIRIADGTVRVTWILGAPADGGPPPTTP